MDDNWTFIWASYGVTWLTFAGYTLSLVLRARDTREGR